MGIEKKEKDQKFISIYKAHVDEVYSFIYLRTGLNQTTAEDLTEEIFVEAYKALSGFRGQSSERTWIFSIARNLLNDFYRKQYRSQMEIACLDDEIYENLPDDSQDVQEMQIKALEKENIRTCLSQLPKQYEIILTLKYMDDKSVKEIAEILEKSPKAIESLLYRAKAAFVKKYRRIIEQEET
ncbi:MAG TPA: RNA polymerase sigma factor [Lachnospiraceae bacterium]|nr:RNA polymerase sigma factor [Lachnospiraceae bacterium]